MTHTFRRMHVQSYSKKEALPPDEIERRVIGAPLTQQTQPQPLSAGALEARALIEKAKQLKDQQENDMPDLKTALETALKKKELTAVVNEWDDEPTSNTNKPSTAMPVANTTTPMPSPKPVLKHLHHSGKQYFTPTNNIARTVFYYIKNNPGISRAAALSALGKNPEFKQNSITSLISQHVRAGHMREVNKGLFTVIDDYRPIKQSELKKVVAARKAIGSTPRPEPTPAAMPERKKVVVKRRGETTSVTSSGINHLLPAPVAATSFDAQAHVDSLTLPQARAVYDYLKKMFGG